MADPIAARVPIRTTTSEVLYIDSPIENRALVVTYHLAGGADTKSVFRVLRRTRSRQPMDLVNDPLSGKALKTVTSVAGNGHSRRHGR